MSRTPKRGKSPGFELWSKKPFSGAAHTSKNKRISRKMDRAQQKEELQAVVAKQTEESKPPKPTHKWSGWPGAFCLDCGIGDPTERAVAPLISLVLK